MISVATPPQPPSDGPEISVIMAARNEESVIEAAIDSILSQSFADFEFIIIDDGSTDTTPAVLARYADPRLVLLRNPVGLGLPASLNKGLAIARGRFIARMDADDLSMPERFAIQHAFLRDNPEIGVCGTYIEKVYPAKNKRKIIAYPQDQAQIVARIHVVCPMAHMTVMARRAVYDATGGYNPFFKRAQDMELWGRVAKNFQITNIPLPLVQVTSRDRLVNLRGLFYGTCAKLRNATRHSRPVRRVVEVLGVFLRDLRRGLVQRLALLKRKFT